MVPGTVAAAAEWKMEGMTKQTTEREAKSGEGREGEGTGRISDRGGSFFFVCFGFKFFFFFCVCLCFRLCWCLRLCYCSCFFSPPVSVLSCFGLVLLLLADGDPERRGEVEVRTRGVKHALRVQH